MESRDRPRHVRRSSTRWFLQTRYFSLYLHAQNSALLEFCFEFRKIHKLHNEAFQF
jgi:hypothetical protein